MTMLLASSASRRLATLAFVGVLGLSLVLTGCDSGEAIDYDGIPSGAVAEVLANLSSTSNLGQSISEAGLADALNGSGTFTVFAPVNQFSNAFLGRGTLLRSNETLLPKALRYHVVPQALTESDLTDGRTFQTLDGATLRISVRDGRTYVNDYPIRRFDVPADNGVIHLIDGVLLEHFRLEERIAVQANLSGLRTALNAAGLLNPDGDDAPLENPGEVTVFAPTNTAFAQYRRLLRNTATGQVLDSVRIAQKFLPYHVVPGHYCAGTTSLQGCQQLAAGQELATLANIPLEIRANAEGQLTANNTRIATTNIRVAEGVIHLIEDVLTKPLNLAEQITIRPDFTRFELIVRASGTFNSLYDESQDRTLLALSEAAVETIHEPAVFGVLTTQGGAANTDVALARKIVQYHLLPEVYCTDTNRYAGTCIEIPAAATPAPTFIENASLTTLTFSRSPTGLPLANGKRLVTTDIETSNGIMHSIEAPLFEPLNLLEKITIFTASTRTLTTGRAFEPSRTRQFLNEAGLASVLTDESRSFTVFAPTNGGWLVNEVDGNDLGGLGTAFTALTEAQRSAILLHHVIEDQEYCFGEAVRPGCQVLPQSTTALTTAQGSQLEINYSALLGFTLRDEMKNTPLAAENIVASNGVFHIIPEVQVPPSVVPVGHLMRYSPLGSEFWRRLQNNPTTTQIIRTQMNTGGPYTVFAFTTGAFRENRETVWQQYGGNFQPALLCYHVVEGLYRASDLQNGQQLTTLAMPIPGTNVRDCSGDPLTVQIQDNEIRIVGTASSGRVVQTDARGSNGIVHFVDNIIRFPR